MADYAHKAATSQSVYLDTVAEYDLYCHYVAGLVGEGLTCLWSASGREASWLCSELELANSMGLMLQKTNIIRDFREDVDERRFFWPREIWAAYGFNEMRDIYAEDSADRATWVQSAMVLDAMRHACDSLDYLRLLRNQSVFVFCAVPACMAIATLALCFMNPDMYKGNIKIRKAEAASVSALANFEIWMINTDWLQLLMRATNSRDVALIFRHYARVIHHKAKPQDPNFLRISVRCGQVLLSFSP